MREKTEHTKNAMINIKSISNKEARDVQKLYYETHEASRSKNGEQKGDRFRNCCYRKHNYMTENFNDYLRK